jgi:hypothetical protein
MTLFLNRPSIKFCGEIPPARLEPSCGRSSFPRVISQCADPLVKGARSRSVLLFAVDLCPPYQGGWRGTSRGDCSRRVNA